MSERTLTDLEHELGEAQAEIVRHHRDFSKIREILDQAGSDPVGLSDDPERELRIYLRKIRNIVG